MISFTVVTCTFNAEHELQRTLDSVSAQNYREVEHLIVDGLSRDGTVSMAKAYRQKSAEADNGHTVVVVSEKDKGLYDAMNKGICMATGTYMVFLNAGDVFPGDDTLERIADSVGDGEDQPGVLYGDTDIVDDKGRFLRHRRLQPPERLTWRSFRAGMLVCHQAFYARTDLAKETFYDLTYRYSADVDWCIRVMRLAEERGLQLKNVDAVIVNYLEGGMSIKNHRASLHERFCVMARHYGWFSTAGMHLWFAVRSVIRK